jgi:hypothetical protein
MRTQPKYFKVFVNLKHKDTFMVVSIFAQYADSRRSAPPMTTSSDLLVQLQFDNNRTTKVFAPRKGTASIEGNVKNVGDRAVS